MSSTGLTKGEKLIFEENKKTIKCAIEVLSQIPEARDLLATFKELGVLIVSIDSEKNTLDQSSTPEISSIDQIVDDLKFLMNDLIIQNQVKK